MTNTDQSPSVDTTVFEAQIGDRTVVEAVLQAVSAVTNTNLAPTLDEQRGADGGYGPLPPLHEVVDTEALTQLVSQSPAGADVKLSFSYAGCRVTVTGTETVRVSEESLPAE